MALNTYLMSKSTGLSNIVKCARVYLNYAEQTDLLSLELINKYRQVLKFPRHNVDVYVPNDSELLKAYNQINHNAWLLYDLAKSMRDLRKKTFIKQEYFQAIYDAENNAI